MMQPPLSKQHQQHKDLQDLEQLLQKIDPHLNTPYVVTLLKDKLGVCKKDDLFLLEDTDIDGDPLDQIKNLPFLVRKFLVPFVR